MSYEPNGCKWIKGKPSRDWSNWCGADRVYGSPYCSEHHERCYIAGSGRSEHPDYDEIAEKRREAAAQLLEFAPPMGYYGPPKRRGAPKHQARRPTSSLFVSADLSWLDREITFLYPHEQVIHELRRGRLSCNEIGKQLGISKNSVVGKLSRMKRRVLEVDRHG